MQDRNYQNLVVSLLIPALIIFLLATKRNNSIPTRLNVDKTSAIELLNQKNKLARRVFCPSIRMGFTSNSSLFYEKKGNMLLITFVIGMKEAMVGCENDEYWFWIRSFDKDSVYFCEKDKLDQTRLRPLMMPETISMIGWIDEIDPKSKIVRLENSFVSETQKSNIKYLTEFDQEKILSQKIVLEDQEILTMKGENYQYFSGHLMPTRILVFWHEEGLSSRFFINEWIINSDDKDTSMPENLKKINLEDYFSSLEKSVSSFFSPILDDHWAVDLQKGH